MFQFLLTALYSTGVWFACLCLLLAFRKARLFGCKARCGRCGYDVRGQVKSGLAMGACPECGYTLGEPRHIHHVYGQFSWRYTAIALIPLVMIGSMWAWTNYYSGIFNPKPKPTRKFVAPQAANGKPQLTFDQLLEQLETAPANSELWADAAQSYSRNKPPKKQRDKLDQLARNAVINSTPRDLQQIQRIAIDDGYITSAKSIHTPFNCLNAIWNQQNLSDQQAIELAKLLYPKKPYVHQTYFTDRLFEGRNELSFDVLQEHDRIQSLTGIDDLLIIKEVMIDGKTIKAKQHRSFNSIRINWKGNLAVGDHKLSLRYHRRFVADLMESYEENNPKRWPKDFLWQEDDIVHVMIKVYKDVDEAVQLYQDHEVDRKLREELKVRYCQVRYREGKRYLQIGLTKTTKSEVNGRPIALSIFYAVPNTASNSSQNKQQQYLPIPNSSYTLTDKYEMELNDDWDYETIDLLVKHDKERVKLDRNIDEILEFQINFEDVKVNRLDRLYQN